MESLSPLPSDGGGMIRNCFICGGVEKEEDLKKLTAQSSPALRHPFFPIPPTFQFPQGIRVCKGCEGHLIVMKGVINRGTNVRSTIVRIRHSQEKNKGFQDEGDDDDVKDLRRVIMYPCDFGWRSSTFGFSVEDVGGQFLSRMPDELLDKIFQYLDPSSLKKVRQVSSFMRSKSLNQFQLKCSFDVTRRIRDDYFFHWPHLKGHRNLKVDVSSRFKVMKDNRLKEFLQEGQAVKRVKFMFNVMSKEMLGSRMGEDLMRNLTNLTELEMYGVMDFWGFVSQKHHLQETDDQDQPNHILSPIFPKLKKVTFISRIGARETKEFMKATPTVTVARTNGSEDLLLLLRKDGDADLVWPHLESINVPKSFYETDDPQIIMDCLGPRPIKWLQIHSLDYAKIQGFMQLLERYGDTVEWIDFGVTVGPTEGYYEYHQYDNYPEDFVPPIFIYKKVDLPTNLKRLQGFKCTLADVVFCKDYRGETHNLCRNCNGITTSRSEELQCEGDFFKISELLQDPSAFRERFPYLRHLSILTQPRNSPSLTCRDCIARKNAICDSIIPLGSFNSDLWVVELSHPTEREDPGLYSAWRERLAEAFPNAKIEEPPQQS